MIVGLGARSSPSRHRELRVKLTPVRFLGFKENEREQELDMNEMTQRAKQGLPLYGESDLTPYLQGVAARNSTYSVFKIQAIPW